MAAKLTYAEQLRHPFWQRKRLQVLDRDGWACVSCGSTEKTLHVHHKRYVKGLMAWEHHWDDLASYCFECHKDDHEIRELLDEMLSRSVVGDSLRRITALVGGYLGSTYAIDSSLADKAMAIDEENYDAGAFVAATGVASWAETAEIVRRLYGDGGLGMGPAVLSLMERLDARARKYSEGGNA